MRGTRCHIYKVVFSLLFLFLTFLTTAIVSAQDIQDASKIKIRRLHDEAERLSERGSYDEAIEKYNEAIKLTQDKDIKQFI